MPAAVAVVLLAAACQPGGEVRSLESLDDGTVTYCAQATTDGSATFALSRVRNTGEDVVVGIESVKLLGDAAGVKALGAYFAPERPGPRSGAPFAPPTDGSFEISAAQEAIVAIGLALDDAPAGEVSGATVTYRTEDGQTGAVTTDLVMRLVEAGAACS